MQTYPITSDEAYQRWLAAQKERARAGDETATDRVNTAMRLELARLYREHQSRELK